MLAFSYGCKPWGRLWPVETLVFKYMYMHRGWRAVRPLSSQTQLLAMRSTLCHLAYRLWLFIAKQGLVENNIAVNLRACLQALKKTFRFSLVCINQWTELTFWKGNLQLMLCWFKGWTLMNERDSQPDQMIRLSKCNCSHSLRGQDQHGVLYIFSTCLIFSTQVFSKRLFLLHQFQRNVLKHCAAKCNFLPNK